MNEKILKIDGEVRCMFVLSYAFRGIYHLGKIRRHGSGFKASVHGYLSTFDSDILTRLVAAAHFYCVRVQVSQGAPRGLSVEVWARHSRQGGFSEKHPDLSEFPRYQESLEAAHTDDPYTEKSIAEMVEYISGLK